MSRRKRYKRKGIEGQRRIWKREDERMRRTPEEQVARLDSVLGKNQGAQRERDKLARFFSYDED